MSPPNIPPSPRSRRTLHDESTTPAPDEPPPSRTPRPPHTPPEHDPRPPKRLRRQTSHAAMTTADPPSSAHSDSSSQSGLADNETEAERSQQSELSAPTTAPPKKKRTRTLTTPHQSAVLHALLAQSRFPTTAMREEVGRQIGLSARKVQIWFQNQRQKARRPRSEGSAPLTRPPQYGPFPNMPTSAPSETASFHPSSEQSSSYPISEHPFGIAGPSRTRDSSAERAIYEDTQRRSFDAGPQLSGPGMPGWNPEYHPASPIRERGQPLSGHRSPDHMISPDSYTSSRASEGFQNIPAPLGIRPLAPRPLLRPFASDETPGAHPRALPPLDFSAPHLRSTAMPYPSSSPRSPAPLLSHPAGNVTQYQSPPSHHGRVAPFVIPPPFALEPQPQWDPRTFSPFSRPGFSPWSIGPRSSLSMSGNFHAAGGPSASGGRPYHMSSGPLRPVSSSRSGRFDPVHDVTSIGQERDEYPPSPASTDDIPGDSDDAFQDRDDAL
ncbi:hypothetical protein SERLA73DRAFT_161532 [Serpula lacrymans var. lacrymans S7.3]|uniref:Homeobox domain-containing protein n=2 Tax=Serpula lacrymans var. lacrymans TaxID=341189 RepID=F8Q2X2_SERL3|nr:uncharacterized protein SERLADRAFT_416582 [Serpula lacrymans var. lacrymans S7.9]EGN97533.1 hypothetical protein SERLA73DRAFT_161532 [Serpula lacrymans var. lacrymans S7.3]EGO23134.1 hypothetical protein SERLADRAFT_416582 [Serpula lacrymans var. lacrymans S7.9]